MTVLNLRTTFVAKMPIRILFVHFCLLFFIQEIRYMVNNIPPLDIEVVKSLEKKLDKCLNPELNPDSDV